MDDESNEAEVDEVNEEATDQNSDEVIVFEPHTVLSKGHMKSLIWKFFVFKGTLSKGAVKDAVFCRLCPKESKYAYSGGTTNLFNHMKKYHNNELKEAEGTSDKKKSDIRSFAVPNVQNNNIKTWNKTSARWKQSTTLLADWICVNNRPFSIVEDEGFIEAMKFIQPEYELPCAKTIVSYIDRTYNEEKSKLMEELKEIDFVAVTTDGGSATNSTSFQDLNVHYIDKDFNLKSNILTVQEIKGAHTAEHIREENDDVLEEWGIIDKVTLTVTDNEPKMVSMYSEGERSGCMAHIEHKSIEKGVEAVAEVSKLLHKVREVSGKYNKSHRFKNTLEEEQAKIGLKVRPLVRDVVNRWGSTKAAFESYLTHKDDLKDNLAYDNMMAVNSTIRKTIKKKYHKDLLIDASEMMMIEHVHKLFTKLDVYTTTLGGDKFVTSSIVVPVMKSIESVLKVQDEDPVYILDLKKEIFQQFKTRCSELLNVDILLKCSALDPRFKRLKFLRKENGDREIIFGKLLEEMRKLSKGDISSSSRGNESSAPEPKKRKLGLVYNESDDEEDNDEDSVVDHLKVELENYRKEPELDKDSDALEWWKARRFQYPTLILLVRKYLCVPATSTQAERVFSKMGLTLTKQRLCMSSSNVDKVLFVGEKCKLSHRKNIK